MKVVILNGPAFSGKDSVYEAMNQSFKNIHHVEFKEALIDLAVRSCGITRDLWNALYTRHYKEVPTPYLMVDGVSVSPRQWLIHMSEDVVKPVFGAAFFGEQAAKKVSELPSCVDSLALFTDGGFPQETIPLINLVGKENLYIVRLHRKKPDGSYYSFEDTNDSRRYLTPEDFPKDMCPVFLDVENVNGKITAAPCAIYEKVFG